VICVKGDMGKVGFGLVPKERLVKVTCVEGDMAKVGLGLST